MSSGDNPIGTAKDNMKDIFNYVFLEELSPHLKVVAIFDNMLN